jgi:hypothetical protein
MLKKIFLMLGLIVLLSLFCVSPVSAFTNDNLEMLTLEGSGDYWYNYDFCSSGDIGDYTSVDHPATIVFGLYAFSSAVKSGLEVNDEYDYSGSTMYNALNDGSGFCNDSDGGRKTNPFDFDAYHYRLYADDGTSMYNTTWGNWTLATTHWDHLPSGYGWQEDVENDICDIAENDIGWEVYEDEYNFFNYDDEYTTGICTYDCNGWASYILVD